MERQRSRGKVSQFTPKGKGGKKEENKEREQAGAHASQINLLGDE